jgi:hypothetical protein
MSGCLSKNFSSDEKSSKIGSLCHQIEFLLSMVSAPYVVRVHLEQLNRKAGSLRYWAATRDRFYKTSIPAENLSDEFKPQIFDNFPHKNNRYEFI